MYNSIWYKSLTPPVLNPPAWLFAPVWGILYVTIITSFVLFIKTETHVNKVKGYIFFIIQIALNIIWSPVFFKYQNIKTALIIVLFMDVFVLLTIIKFYKINKIAGLILIPYFLWIIFASYLNLGFLILN